MLILDDKNNVQMIFNNRGLLIYPHGKNHWLSMVKRNFDGQVVLIIDNRGFPLYDREYDYVKKQFIIPESNIKTH